MPREYSILPNACNSETGLQQPDDLLPLPRFKHLANAEYAPTDGEALAEYRKSFGDKNFKGTPNEATGKPLMVLGGAH